MTITVQVSIGSHKATIAPFDNKLLILIRRFVFIRT